MVIVALDLVVVKLLQKTAELSIFLFIAALDNKSQGIPLLHMGLAGEVTTWLDQDKNPIIVQFPIEALDALHNIREL